MKSCQKALVIYDATLYFCDRFFRHDRRQTDQMVQAARSGKQNIVEGSLAAATSKQTEIHLTNVAKASLGELQEDYEDFLRDKKLPAWDKEHPSALRLTGRSRQAEEVYATYGAEIEHASPEISANTIRHLIIQAVFLRERQIQRLEQDFLQSGGIRERMTAARCDTRNAPPKPAAAPNAPWPNCPQCGTTMRRGTAHKGPQAGKDAYPACKATRPLDAGENQQGGRRKTEDGGQKTLRTLKT